MVRSIEQALKTPLAYIDETFIQKLQRSKEEIKNYELRHACKLVEPRLIEILNPHEQTYQKGTILTQNNIPVAILKDHHQEILIPFENNIFPEGIYWLNKEIFSDIQKQIKPVRAWNTYEIQKLDIFPVRPLQGPKQETLRKTLEKEYTNLLRQN